MATDMSYVFYDTAAFGTTAETEHELFQNKQGSSASFTKFVTNSRGAGEFPQNESFVCKQLMFFPDDDLSPADTEAYLNNSYVEIRQVDRIVFQAPLRACVALAAYGGHYSEATASDDAMIGVVNDGFMLDIPLNFKGGDTFRVVIGQGTALSAAKNFKFAMVGTFTQ